jgi:hypothetical protein
MRTVVAGVRLLVVVAVVPGIALAGGNEAPLPEAGLDQQADVGHTVRLDAGGSVDPDGSIASYEWVIERPDGSTMRSADPRQAMTYFVPRQVGQYNVTVRVTDDDGAIRTDTLYVDVRAGEGPSVSVSGPGRPSVGATPTYTASLSAGDVALTRATWLVNGSRVDSPAVGGERASVSHDLSLSAARPRNVTVRVTDVAGQQATETLVVRPRRPRGGATAGGATAGGIDGLRGNQYEYEWAGRTITVDMPETCISDCEDNPTIGGMPVEGGTRATGEALDRIAAAGPGESVRTDFVGTDPANDPDVSTLVNDANGVGGGSATTGVARGDF